VTEQKRAHRANYAMNVTTNIATSIFLDGGSVFTTPLTLLLLQALAILILSRAIEEFVACAC